MNLISFDEHHCKKARSYLDSYLDDELSSETSREVLAHLSGCGGCVGELAARERVKRLLGGAVRKTVAPDELRVRIQKSVRHDAGAGFRRWSLVAAAAVILLVGAWGALRHMGGGGDRAVEVLRIGLKDHVECAVKHNFASSRLSIEEMGARLGGQYAGLVPIIRQRVPRGYGLTAAHACNVGGREYAHLVLANLNNGESPVSLVITRKGADGFPEGDLGATLEASGVTAHAAGVDDYQAVGFETRDFLGFVVSGLSREENLRIASLIMPGLRDFLAGLES